jgi:Na+/phosphate symporter
MSDLGHIFTPANDSLEARIAAFKAVRMSSNALKESSKYADGWGDMLGSDEELEQAKEIMQNSLTEAARSIHQNELIEVQEKSLLKDEELHELAKIKRQVLMDQMREKKSKQVELIHSLKR